MFKKQIQKLFKLVSSCPRHADLILQLFKAIFVVPRAYMIFFVTAHCNARCDFCFYWKEIENVSKRKQLSLNEIDRLTINLRHLLYLSIGGGEPFLRTDLADIVSLFYRNCKTRFVNITTNGLLPERIEQQVKRILTENPYLNLKIGISIDAIGKDHDDLRKVPGAFDKAVETARRLSGLREHQRFFGINIATTFSKFNEDQVTNVIDFVYNELDVNDHTLTFVRGDAKNKRGLSASVKKYKQAITYLDSKYQPSLPIFRIQHNLLRIMFQINVDTLEKDRMIIPCVAAGKMITLDDQGMLKPCEMLEEIYQTDRFNIGNIREVDCNIEHMAETPKACEIRKWIQDTNCYCTFECANMANIVFNYKSWPKVAMEFVKKI